MTPPDAVAPRWRRWRIAALLVVLAFVSLKYACVRRAESWVPDWQRSQVTSVALLVPEGATAEEAHEVEQLQRFLRSDEETASLRALQAWVRAEFARYVDRPGFEPISLSIAGPLAVGALPPPPPLAAEELSFAERYSKTSKFLAYYEVQRGRLGIRAPNVVFVSFYRPSDAPYFRRVHSVADRRSHTGFVFAPLTRAGAHTALVNVGHELLHLFGASDKYAGERCVFPEGYYEPLQEPRHPQRYAEVMAQGIPTAEGRKEASLDRFDDMRVGVATAFEIGWIDRARRDRYYAGDVAASPRLQDR